MLKIRDSVLKWGCNSTPTRFAPKTEPSLRLKPLKVPSMEVTMASTQKQAKRAKRAKTKAKQARTVRSSTPKGMSEELLDDIAQGMIGILMRMAEAEVISKVEMLTTLMRETGMAKAKSLDDEIDNQIVILKVYGGKVEGRSEDWMEDTGFLEAYAEAARRLDREELIEAWNDAHDF